MSYFKINHPDIFINEFGGGNGHIQSFRELWRQTDPERQIYYSFKHPYPELMAQDKNLLEVTPTDYNYGPGFEKRYIPTQFSDKDHYDGFKTLFRVAFACPDKALTRVKDWISFYEEAYEENGKKLTAYFDYAPLALLAFRIFQANTQSDHLTSIVYGAGVCNIPLRDDKFFPTYQSFIPDNTNGVSKQNETFKVLLENNIRQIIKELTSKVKADSSADLWDFFQPDNYVITHIKALDPYKDYRKKWVYYRDFRPTPTETKDPHEPLKTPGVFHCFGYIGKQQLSILADFLKNNSEVAYKLYGTLVVGGLPNREDIQFLQKQARDLTIETRLLNKDEKKAAFEKADLIFTNGSIGFLNEAAVRDMPIVILQSMQMDQRITGALAVELLKQRNVPVFQLGDSHKGEDLADYLKNYL